MLCLGLSIQFQFQVKNLYNQYLDDSLESIRLISINLHSILLSFCKYLKLCVNELL
jgi:hypothetical protein